VTQTFSGDRKFTKQQALIFEMYAIIENLIFFITQYSCSMRSTSTAYSQISMHRLFKLGLTDKHFYADLQPYGTSIQFSVHPSLCLHETGEPLDGFSNNFI
jgi:hypothetical protein